MSGQKTGQRFSTTIKWLHAKKLVTDNELLTGEIHGVLLEWRLTLVGPIDSTLLFAEKYMRTAPLLQGIAVEFHLKDMLLGTKRGGEDAVMREANIERLGGRWSNEETAKDRDWRKLASWNEWLRVQKLFRDALPEYPDALADLGRAATERIPVKRLPHRQVPLICSALYLLKEYWREVLLMETIDDATGIIAQAA
jgi:hypothetical protein